MVPYVSRNHKATCSLTCRRYDVLSRMNMKALGESISKGKKGKTHKGAPHSEETKTHLSVIASDGRRKGVGNAMFGKLHNQKSRDQMSETRTRKIINGEYDRSKWAKRGELFAVKANRVIPYRSSFERRAIEIIEADENVISFKFESIRISYCYGNRVDGSPQNRYYIPDFLIERIDGSTVLMEVKPICYLESAINVAKFAAAREYCVKNGWTFEVWTQKELLS